MPIMSKEEQKTENNKRINKIDEEEEEELENKKMEMFFSLIKSYHEAKKRRRHEITHDFGEAASIPTKRSDSGIVPVFRPEDFFHCTDLNLKQANSISPIEIQEKDKVEDDAEDDDAEDDDDAGEEEKEIIQDNGLDLNLAL